MATNRTLTIDEKTTGKDDTGQVKERTVKNKYDISKLMYPLNLLDAPEYSGNKVVFFINVQSGAKRSGITSSERTQFSTFDIPDSDKNLFSGQKIAQQINTVAGSLGVENRPLAAAELRRLSAAIALHMPNALMQSTSVSWSDVDMFEQAKILEPLGKILAGQPVEALKAGASAVASTVIKESELYQRASRMTQGNSKAEMLFQSVGFRNFEFSYTFAPKNEKEAENAMNIIRMFKHHMLPEYFDTANFLYVYPSEFNIKYYRGDKENQYIEKQITSVLTNVSVDYAPDGQFQTFSNGMSSKMNLRLSFMETGVPTKETSPFDAHGV